MNSYGRVAGWLARKLWVSSAVTLALCCAASAGAQATGTWYKGDLHAHSAYSDGDSSVADVLASATAKGLDFFALTDHDNDLNGNPLHWLDPDYASVHLVLLYGMEWSTGKGHANVWGPGPFDYQRIWEANRNEDPTAASAEAHRQGALYSINHAGAFTCCPWEYPIVEGVDIIEVWNGMYRLPYLNRWVGHQFWDGVLQKGRRVPGVGGSDTHQLKGLQALLFGHGNPTTWVFAEAKTASAILAGIKAGHVSISYAPGAPRLDFRADANSDGVYEAMVGDSLPMNTGAITFRIDVGSAQAANQSAMHAIELAPALVKALREGLREPEELLRSAPAGSFLAGVFRNGELFKVFLLPAGSGTATFKDTATVQGYYRVELMGDPDVPTDLQTLLYGRILALTNPIYIGY